MSTTPPNVLQLARQGDPDAIAALMNRHLETQGITARVVQQESTLQVNLEGAQIPNQVDLVAFVKKGITGLELAAIHRLTVSGKQLGASASAWSEDLVLQTVTSDFELDFDAAPEDAIAGDTLASDDLDLGFDLDSTALDTTDLGDLDAALGNDLNGADLDLDLDLGLTNSELGLEAPTDLEFTDSDFGLDLSDAGSGPGVADSFDLDLSDAGSGSAFADDLNLDLSDDLVADLTTDSGFDLDLGLPEETSADPNGFDLDLGLSDELPAEPIDLDFDLGLTEAGTQPPTDADMAFDLGLTDGPAAGDAPADLAFDMDFNAEPATSASDLDFDLDLDDSATDASADLDLGWTEEPAAASPAEALDLDFGTTEAPATDLSTAELDAELDFDLDLTETPADTSVTDDLELDTADFDLEFTPEAAGSGSGLGAFDLDLTETPPDASTTDDLVLDTADFDLEFAPEAAGSEVSLESSDDLDLDFGTESEASLGASDDLDLDFGTEFDPAGDLGLAATDADFGESFGTEALGTESFGIEDLGVEDLGTEDLGTETFGTEEFGAIAEVDDLEADGSAFDLNSPPAPLTAPEIEADLDDLWGDTDISAIVPEPTAADLYAVDDLAAFDTDLTSNLNSSEESLDEWGDLGAVPEDLGTDTGDADAIAFADLGLEADAGDADAIAFADLGFEADAPLSETADNPDDLPPDLIIAEPSAFEDLGAADDLDLAGGLDLSDDWSTASPELSLSEADTDLSDPADLTLTDVDLAADSSAEALDPSTTNNFDDFDLAAGGNLPSDLLSEDALATDWGAAAPELSADLGTDFDADLGTDFDADWADPAVEPGTDTSAQPWQESTGDFDPDLALDTSGNANDLGTEFDPGLVFDSSAEAVDADPNPFATGAFLPAEDDPYAFTAPGFEAEAGNLDAFAPDATPGFEPEFALEADADLPFSTMELDQTAAGNFVPDPALDDSPSELDAYDDTFFVDQPEAYAAEAEPDAVGMGFGGDAADDLAFESVEFEGNDFGGSGFETPGFSVGAFSDEPDFEAPAFEEEGFGNEGLGNEGFGEEGFGADVFSDSHEDSNGFIQDRNGAALIDDEPDATDDFIQEFGSDPSTHVALTPDQFNDDGSVRRSGSSGLPLRLIGLVGALVLAALAGFMLLGRLRGPEGDPAVTQPAPNPDSLPTDPAAVAEEDVFRQAVNAAQTAANQAQTASTPAQWQEVADAWALAISLMQRVPDSDPNYATAQQKAVDYQPNLNYAQQNAAQ
ncbi:hypothetical protein IQ265_21705 [Nodosilinea sp. LEGE 06152]|uniref:hypothetical protein n=1 Tax=Nodosilinea sp. LEGE 06152 TaxID=2777966 RepID=UPI001881C08B|nr:hypothetical protein [Nodosilinea sp. LEGE 06152]MBE9159424.1 hypothetical protein [Nodosilinea sp. LEGE 06152]